MTLILDTSESPSLSSDVFLMECEVIAGSASYVVNGYRDAQVKQALE